MKTLIITVAAAGVMVTVSAGAAPAPHPVGHKLRFSPTCIKLDIPKKMPTLGVLFDSASFMKQLQDIDANITGDVTIGVNSMTQPSAHVVEQPGESPLSEAVRKAALATLQSNVTDAPPAFRIRVKRGKSTEVKLERALLCMQVSTENATALSQAQTSFKVVKVTEGQMPPSGTMRSPSSSMNARVRIDKTGKAVEVDIRESSGSQTTDNEARRQIMAAKYSVATLDGVPVEVWLAGSKFELVR